MYMRHFLQTCCRRSSRRNALILRHMRRLSAGYIPPAPRNNKSTVVFSIRDYPGALEEVLRNFTNNDVNMTRIESRFSQRDSEVNFFCDVSLPANHRRLAKLIGDLRGVALWADVAGSAKVPWFPITLEEVDSLALNVLDGGSDLQADHPGFHDEEYRKRRQEIADAAAVFRLGEQPMRVKYTPQELECWKEIWMKLVPLIRTHACSQYLEIFDEFQKHCGYREDNIPQLGDVSHFIYDRTGFQLRPTAGLLSSRDFLNGLAFNTFFCTQYLRHHSVPFYTPEPDVVHELVGHAPMFADPEFARFSQEIGLASIGATDEQIEQLARCYWFSVEFGLCYEKGETSQRKIYGAGVLSSFGEIEYSMGSEPEFRDWDPFSAAKQDFPITTYQPIYYVAKSFEDAKERMSEFAESLSRPFSVRWNDVDNRLDVDRNIERQDRDEFVAPENPYA